MPRENVCVHKQDRFWWADVRESEVTASFRVKPVKPVKPVHDQCVHPLPFMIQTKAWDSLPPYVPPNKPKAAATPAVRCSRSVERQVLQREIASQENAAVRMRRNHANVLKINAALANAMRRDH
jgi:hypothetical protein